MAVLPKRNTVPITSRKKAVPGIKSSEPPVPIIEEKILPKPTPPRRAVPPRRPAPTKTITKPEPVEVKSLTTEEQAIVDLINHRQRQVIVHSVIYYRMNENVVSDDQWSTWARELYSLQLKYPVLAKHSVFYEDLKNFDPATGFELADHSWGMKVAPSIIRLHREYHDN